MVNLEEVRHILSPGYLSISEICDAFKVRYTPEQLEQLHPVPYERSELERCAESHLLFPGYPFSIRDIQERASRIEFSRCRDEDTPKGQECWYDRERFVLEERVELRWYLTSRSVVEGSTDKDFSEQTMLLRGNERVPRACEFVFALVAYRMAKHHKLFRDHVVRCQDVAASGERVCVGEYIRGLSIMRCDDHWTKNHLAITSMRCPKSKK